MTICRSFVMLTSLLVVSPLCADDGSKRDDAPKQTTSTNDATPTKPSKPDEKSEGKEAKPKTPPKLRASEIAGAAFRMAGNMKCAGCSGDGDNIVSGGKVSKGRSVGSDAAPARLQPKKGTRKLDECEACDGLGLRQGDTVWNTATNFVDKLAQLNVSDPEWAKSRKEATADGLQKTAQLGLDRLARKLNEPAIESLFSAGSEPRKQRVALVGVVAKAPEIGAGDIVIDSSRGYLMLRAPLVTRCLPMERVFTGGVWTGMTNIKVFYLDEQGREQEKEVPARVLESSFVVAP